MRNASDHRPVGNGSSSEDPNILTLSSRSYCQTFKCLILSIMPFMKTGFTIPLVARQTQTILLYTFFSKIFFRWFLLLNTQFISSHLTMDSIVEAYEKVAGSIVWNPQLSHMLPPASTLNCLLAY